MHGHTVEETEKSGVVLHAWNPISQEEEAGGSVFQGYSWLHNEFEVI